MAYHSHALSLRWALVAGVGVSLLEVGAARAEPAPSVEAQDAPARGVSAGYWQGSLYATGAPAIGEAKRGDLEGGPVDLALGYGLRLERNLSDWWTAGFSLSSRGWEIDAPAEATGVLAQGSFVDAALLIKFHPLNLEVASGPLSVYLAVAAGPTLAGDDGVNATTDAAAQAERLELVSFEAGYNASTWLGASWLPFEQLGLFVEAGLDWHFAIHTRNVRDFTASAAAERPPIAEKLWLGQGLLNVGVLYRF